MEGSQIDISADQSRFCESKSAIKSHVEYSLLSNCGGVAMTLLNSILTEYHIYKTILSGKD